MNINIIIEKLEKPKNNFICKILQPCPSSVVPYLVAFHLYLFVHWYLPIILFYQVQSMYLLIYNFIYILRSFVVTLFVFVIIILINCIENKIQRLFFITLICQVIVEFWCLQHNEPIFYLLVLLFCRLQCQLHINLIINYNKT